MKSLLIPEKAIYMCVCVCVCVCIYIYIYKQNILHDTVVSSICLAILFYHHIYSQAVSILSDSLTKNYSYNF